MTAPTRLISSDDHVDVTPQQVKAFLHTKHHDAYDAAIARVENELRGRSNLEMNRRWRQQQNLAAEGSSDKGYGGIEIHPASGRAGHSDPRARLADMDADGVLASSSYCEVSAFRFLYLVGDGAAEATRAFNTALAAFASADPERLVVSYQIPIHDVDMAVNEVRWAKANGCKSLQLPVFPAELGLPDYWDIRYDPQWTAIQDADLPVCLHIGLKLGLEDVIKRDPTPMRGVFIPMVQLATSEALGMWLLTGVLERHRHLRLVFVESGIGWVAWWLNQVDDMKVRQGYEFPGLRHAPSDYFHRNVHLTFIDEPDVMHHANRVLGVENVMWSSDYPHPIGSWPHSRSTVERVFAGVSDEDRDRLGTLTQSNMDCGAARGAPVTTGGPPAAIGGAPPPDPAAPGLPAAKRAGTLVSVNVGVPKDVLWQGRTVFTGVFKDPVGGARFVGRLNIDGDGQGDLAGHGGEQRAVFVYQLGSYRYWERELRRNDFVYGQFGENFTVEGLADDEVCIGDRYRIGSAAFEVTQPRVTCYRVGIRMNDPRIPALLVSHHRPGFYFRVLEEGEVQAGDEIIKVTSGPEHLTVAEVDALLYLPGHPRQGLLRALRVPALSPGWQWQRRPGRGQSAARVAGLSPVDRQCTHA